MLLTIGTTRAPATDLGYALGKHPGRTQSFDLTFGRAHVYYPEAGDDRCTAALLLDVDPVGLVRRAGDRSFALSQYTNDRPYVASSFMSVAIGRVFGAALGGRCRDRPELAETTWPLHASLVALPARGGERLVRALFEPLGYAVDVRPLEARYFALSLAAEVRLADLLRHLTVLIPVLDDDKHYWVGDEEVDKLLARGEGWLAQHPRRDEIAKRYLKHQRRLTRMAMSRLVENGETELEAIDEAAARDEEALERPLTLDERRRLAVVEVLRRHGVRSVVDVGCGEGRLLRALLADRSFERVVGMDVSVPALERARDRLRLDELGERARARVELFHGSLTYRDPRLEGFDAACAIEVIEHIDATRLSAFEAVLFASARPRVVVVTTPNVEYNVRFAKLPAGQLRHRDHRFEWTRAELESWARRVATQHGYALELLPIGDVDPELGPPTQMAVFSR
jgi:3' terminal RNA ribose 2'-O-methyltransferase Hen1